MNPAIIRITSIVASCVVLIALAGCTTPHRTLYGTDVIPVASIGEVLSCKFKGTFSATVTPGARPGSNDMDHPVNSKVDRDLLVDARNLAQEIMVNRILWRSIPFKGSRRFDAFYCREKSTLSSYADHIDAKKMLRPNLVRLCTEPGSAQGADFEKYCSEQFQPNTFTDKFSTDEKINAILERLCKDAGAVMGAQLEMVCK